MDITNPDIIIRYRPITDTEITSSLESQFTIDKNIIDTLSKLITYYLSNPDNFESFTLNISHIINNFTTPKSFKSKSQYPISLSQFIITLSLSYVKVIINDSQDKYKNSKLQDLFKLLFYLYYKNIINISTLSNIFKSLININLDQITRKKKNSNDKLYNISIQEDELYLINLVILSLYQLKINIPSQVIIDMILLIENELFQDFVIKLSLNRNYYFLLLLGLSNEKNKEELSQDPVKEIKKFLLEIYFYNIDGEILNIIYKNSFTNITFLNNSIDFLSELIEFEKEKILTEKFSISRGFIISNNNPLTLSGFKIKKELSREEQLLFISSFRLFNKRNSNSKTIILTIKTKSDSYNLEIGTFPTNILYHKIKKNIDNTNITIQENEDYLLILKQDSKTLNIYLYDFNKMDINDNANNTKKNKHNKNESRFSILGNPIRIPCPFNEEFFIELGTENFDGLFGDFLIMKVENNNEFIGLEKVLCGLLNDYYLVGTSNLSNKLSKDFYGNEDKINSYVHSYRYFHENQFEVLAKISIDYFNKESPYKIEYDNITIKYKNLQLQTTLQIFEHSLTFFEFMRNNGSNFILFLVHYLFNPNLKLDNDILNSLINSLINIINKLLEMANDRYFSKNCEVREKKSSNMNNNLNSNINKTEKNTNNKESSASTISHYEFLVLFFMTLFNNIEIANSDYDKSINNKNDKKYVNRDSVPIEKINLNDFNYKKNEPEMSLGYKVIIKSDLINSLTDLIISFNINNLSDDDKLCSFIVYNVLNSKLLDRESVRNNCHGLISAISSFFKRCNKHLMSVDFLNKILSFDYVIDYKDNTFTSRFFLFLDNFFKGNEKEKNFGSVDNKNFNNNKDNEEEDNINFIEEKNNDDKKKLIFSFFGYLVLNREKLSKLQKLNYLKFIYISLINKNTVKSNFGKTKIYKNFIEIELNNNKINLNYLLRNENETVTNKENKEKEEQENEKNIITCICYALKVLLSKYNKLREMSIVEFSQRDNFYLSPSFEFLRCVFIIIFDDIDNDLKIDFILNCEEVQIKNNVFNFFKGLDFPVNNNNDDNSYDKIFIDLNDFVSYIKLILNKSSQEYVDKYGKKIILFFHQFVLYVLTTETNSKFKEKFICHELNYNFYKLFYDKFPKDCVVSLTAVIQETVKITNNGFFYYFLSNFYYKSSNDIINKDQNEEDKEENKEKEDKKDKEPYDESNINDKFYVELLKVITTNLVNINSNDTGNTVVQINNVKILIILHNIVIKLYRNKSTTLINEYDTLIKLYVPYLVNNKYHLIKYLFEINNIYSNTISTTVKDANQDTNININNKYKSIIEIVFDLYFIMMKLSTTSHHQYNKMLLCDLLLTESHRNSILIIIDVPNLNLKKMKIDNKKNTLSTKVNIEKIIESFEGKNINFCYTFYFLCKINFIVSELNENLRSYGITNTNYEYVTIVDTLNFINGLILVDSINLFDKYMGISNEKKFSFKIGKHINTNSNKNNIFQTFNENENDFSYKIYEAYNRTLDFFITSTNIKEEQFYESFDYIKKGLNTKYESINTHINCDNFIKINDEEYEDKDKDKSEKKKKIFDKYKPLKKLKNIFNKELSEKDEDKNERKFSMKRSNSFKISSSLPGFSNDNEDSDDKSNHDINNSNNFIKDFVIINDYANKKYPRKYSAPYDMEINKNKNKRKKDNIYSLYGFDVEQLPRKRLESVFYKEKSVNFSTSKKIQQLKNEPYRIIDVGSQESQKIDINLIHENIDNIKEVKNNLIEANSNKRSKSHRKSKEDNHIENLSPVLCTDSNSYSFLLSNEQKEVTEILCNPKDYFLFKNFTFYFKDDLFYDKIFKRLQVVFEKKLGKNIKKITETQDNFHTNFPMKILNYICDDYYRPFVKPCLNFYTHPSFKISHSYFNYDKNNQDNLLLSLKFNKIFPSTDEINKTKFTCESVNGIGSIFGEIEFNDLLIHFIDKSYRDRRFDKNADIDTKFKYIFSSDMSDKVSGKGKHILIYLDEINEVFIRRFCLLEIGLEIFLKNKKSYLFNFFDDKYLASFLEKLTLINKKRNLNISIVNNLRESFKQKNYMKKYQQRKIDNFNYILLVNKYSCRTYNDISQYPVMPWIISTINPTTPRILGRAICIQKFLRQGEKDEDILIKYKGNLVSLGCNFMIHYCNSGYIMHYLIRMIPITYDAIRFQSNQFDQPSRIFFSIKELLKVFTILEDNRELIPEFYCDFNFMLNLNKNNLGFFKDRKMQINSVKCEGFNTNIEYIVESRKSLDKNDDIPSWLDNIFGYYQLNDKILNVFPLYTYRYYNDFREKIQRKLNKGKSKEEVYKKIRTKIGLLNLGVTPYDLFTSAHVKRGQITNQEDQPNSNSQSNNANMISTDITTNTNTNTNTNAIINTNDENPTGDEPSNETPNNPLPQVELIKKSDLKVQETKELKTINLKEFIMKVYDDILSINAQENKMYILFENKLKCFEIFSNQKISESFEIDIKKQMQLHMSENYSYCEIFKKKLYALVRYGDKSIKFYNSKHYLKSFLWNCFVSSICQIEKGEICIGDKNGYLAKFTVIQEESNVKIYLIKNVQAHCCSINGIIYDKRLNIIISFDCENNIVIKNAYSFNTIMIYNGSNCYGDIKDIKVSKYDFLFVVYEKIIFCYTFSGIVVSLYNATEGIIKGFGINDDNATVVIGDKQNIYVCKNYDFNKVVMIKKTENKMIEFNYWEKIKMGYVILEGKHNSQFINLNI